MVAKILSKLVCQECGGMGGRVQPILDFGEGPFEECGFCNGTGIMTSLARNIWLLDKKKRKRKCGDKG